MKVNIKSVVAKENIGELDCHRVSCHSHNLRSKQLCFEDAKENLLKWTRDNKISAFGVGSPWDPKSFKLMEVFESSVRDEYYAGIITNNDDVHVIPDEYREEYYAGLWNDKDLMVKDAVFSLIDDLNKRSNGKTLFYLDNETPKNRYGHLWYIGFDYIVPAWHDYSQDKINAFSKLEKTDDINHITKSSHIRRSYAEVIAQQRESGALAVWAHPTSWWTQDGAFVTNIAAELYLHLFSDGFLDGLTVQGYDAYHRWYQNIWFDMLDRGAHVPGFAELDECFDTLNVFNKPVFANEMFLPENFTLEDIKERVRKSNHSFTNGPKIRMSIAGRQQGERILCEKGDSFEGVLTVYPAPEETKLAFIQIVGRGGKVLAEIKDFEGGEIHFSVEIEQENEYVIARAFGESDSPYSARQQDVKYCAFTNPIFLSKNDESVLSPVKTNLEFCCSPLSKYYGMTFKIVSPSGSTIYDQGVLNTTRKHFKVSPLCRIIVEQDGVVKDDIPIAYTNKKIRSIMDYLSRGEFRKDFEGLTPGEVPLEAFRIEEMLEGMQKQLLVL